MLKSIIGKFLSVIDQSLLACIQKENMGIYDFLWYAIPGENFYLCVE